MRMVELRPRHARPGLTLVETLIALFVVALLTALAIVALRQTRSKVTMLVDVTNIGSTFKDFAAYAAEHDGKLPNAGLPPTEPGASWTPYWPTANMSVDAMASQYWGQVTSWPRVVSHWKGRAEAYWHPSAGPDIRHAPPGVPPEAIARQPLEWAETYFLYSYTMLSRPSLWTYPGRGATSYGPLLPEFEVVSLSRIRSPASKGVLVCLESPTLPKGELAAAFADGSASNRKRSDAKPMAVNPTASIPTTRGQPVLTTMSGYEGADY